MIKKINIFGLGYIGLPLALILANKKTIVHGIDVNDKLLNKLSNCESPFVENGIDKMLSNALNKSFFTFSKEPSTDANIHVIAVPTPLTKNNKADMSYVKSAVIKLCKVIKKNDLVIIESTSPVGTTNFVANLIIKTRKDLKYSPKDHDFHIAYCPERVIPGTTFHELISNDRVIGGFLPCCSSLAIEFYQIFVKSKLHTTNAETAEMVKLSENTFRDVNIALSNELSMIASKYKSINIFEMIKLANYHPRVNLLNPGVGVGGHCISVDPWFLVQSSLKFSKLTYTARTVNISKTNWVINEICNDCINLKGKVGLLGLTFKPNVDDFRESPSIIIFNKLLKKIGNKLLFNDPYVTLNESFIKKNIKLYRESVDQLFDECEKVYVLTNHDLYKKFKTKYKEKCVLKFVEYDH